MRAVIYARYSTDSQSAASIDDQLRLCKERVAREGWVLQQVYRDAAMSGASSLRPGYQALFQAARQAECDVIVAEALDRLSRDQEDMAALFKRCRFAGVQILTLAEGEISELHVGLKGTMNALFLKDLADKTRRGLRGRIEAGASGGGITYGYDIVPSLKRRGARRINDAQAAVVRRIFENYRDGLSPRRIALDLNQAGIAGPRGGAWSSSTINGSRKRGTGILNNELYVGRLVWNRLRYSKDPDDGRRKSRLNTATDVVTRAVPELSLIDEELWQSARARQARLSHRENTASKAIAGAATRGAFWSKQRPRYLFSGLMRCGVCGGGFSKISAAHFGCSTARNKGPTSCTNLLTVRQDRVETTVLDGLRDRLVDPELSEAFAAEFTAERSRRTATLSSGLTVRKAELDKTKRQIERLVDALVNGTPVSAVKDRLRVTEDRRLALEAEIEAWVTPAPQFHLNLATVYCEKVASLTQAFMAEGGAAAMELVRSLVDEIRLVPENGANRIELRGELAAIFGPADSTNTNGDHRNATAGGELIMHVKRVARAMAEHADGGCVKGGC